MQTAKPNIFIYGRSGSGKSSSIKNCPPDKTIILNLDKQILPFRHANTFKRQRFINSYEEFLLYFQDPNNPLKEKEQYSVLNSDAEIIIIDTFTALQEYMMRWGKHNFSKTQTFEMWDWFADEILRIVEIGKTANKYVVFLGHEDEIQDSDNRLWRHIYVQGRKRKGRVENEFIMVFYAGVDTSSDIKYYFLTNADGVHNAKSPEGMFEDAYIPNDINAVIQAAENYYGGNDVDMGTDTPTEDINSKSE